MRSDGVPSQIDWDGRLDRTAMHMDEARVRHDLADAAKRYDWGSVLDIIHSRPVLINVARPGSKSLYAPLHQAANGDAPSRVVEALVAAGAWRMLRNARGERATDVARRKGHSKVADLLEPEILTSVPATGAASHRAGVPQRDPRAGGESPPARRAMRLPAARTLPRVSACRKFWFAIPGMYGGFAYTLEGSGPEATLVAESWNRVSRRAQASGTKSRQSGATLVASGFG